MCIWFHSLLALGKKLLLELTQAFSMPVCKMTAGNWEGSVTLSSPQQPLSQILGIPSDGQALETATEPGLPQASALTAQLQE